MPEQAKKSFLKGAIFGAIGGAISGILLAPKSGKQTREDIKKLAEDLGDRAEEVYLNAQKELKAKIENIKQAGQLIDEAKYKELVSEVVRDLRSNQEVTEKTGEKLGMLLKNDWEMVKKQLSK
ncbi:MAG TPA: YtxH domain-containing protein [Candidatus Dojkabacteria bacterium]|nr:YtxH domain-containing protein [Candidatus Dojkabacteria bacterium]HOV34474.1 YtxH domain-containing protein [Candidatus Dojkabacteria bacterium]